MKKRTIRTIWISIAVMGTFLLGDAQGVYASAENGMVLEEELLEGVAYNMTPVHKTIRLIDKVNLRSAPDTSTDSIAELDGDTTYYAIGITDNDWYQISYEGQVGYIRADFVEVEEVDSALVAEMEESVKNQEAIIEAEIQEQLQAQLLAEEEAKQAELQKQQEEKEAKEREAIRLASERTSRNFAIIIAGLLLITFGAGLVLIMKGMKNSAVSGEVLSNEEKMEHSIDYNKEQNKKDKSQTKVQNEKADEGELDLIQLDDEKNQ